MDEMGSIRGEISALRQEMQLGFARMEARFAQVDAKLEKAMREQTRFFFVAWSVLLAMIVGLYVR